MPQRSVTRKLTAILYADVAGYSRLVGEDELGTHAQLAAGLRRIAARVEAGGGRVVHTAGDAVLAEFPSVVSTLEAALDVQCEMTADSAGIAEARRLRFRIGINLGEVVVDGVEIYGEGVNVAARLEGLAEPGGICVSAAVHEQVRGKLEVAFEDLGEREVKNIASPVRAYRVVLDEPAATATVPTPVLPADRPSIAVLPFENLSADPEQEYFADGMAEDIITGLSRFRWLLVIARNSSFVYKGRAVDVREVARDLGVRFVLEGSVRRADRRVRVTAQLIDAESGGHIWSERYDREVGDIFAIQDAITDAIVQAIAPQIDQHERLRARRRPPGSVDAWSLFQNGLASYHLQTEAGLRQAAVLFDKAAASDPGFATALAYAGAARNRLVLNYSPPDGEVLLAEVRERVDEALTLDLEDPVGLFVAGVLASIGGDHAAALEKVRQALTLNPNAAYVWGILAFVERTAGHPTEALDACEQAMRLSPHDAGMPQFLLMRVVALFDLGRYRECVVWGRRAVGVPAPFPGAFVAFAAALHCLGRDEEAASVLAEVRRRFPRYAWDNPRTRPSDGAPTATEVLQRAGLIE